VSGKEELLRMALDRALDGRPEADTVCAIAFDGLGMRK
jgi:hypothetical protein